MAPDGEGTDVVRLVHDRYPTGMPVAEAISIVTAIAATLDDARHRGLSHHDPLTDFGIRRPIGRSDQYALATTAYHLFTGTQPDERMLIPLPGERRPELRPFDWVFATALAEDPTREFSSCGDFALALAGGYLQASRAEATAPAQPPPPAPVAVPAVPNPRPRRRGRALLIVVVVLALIAGGTAFTLGKMHAVDAARQLAADREGARLAGQRYLEALAGGDAATALSLAAQPPTDTRFLTADILRAQLATLPITDIFVSNAPDAADGTQPLLLSAKFGAIPSQTTLAARKVDGQWKLGAITVPLTIGTDPADKALRVVALSGVATAGASFVSVFPGLPQVSTINRFVDLTADVKPVLLEALTDPTARPPIVPNVTLNDAGRTASLEAVERFQESCNTGTPPSYKCCPNGSCSPPPSQNHGIDGKTTRIISRTSVEDVTYDFDPAAMLVIVNGLFRYNGEAQVWGNVQDIRFSITATDNLVDLLLDPPEKVQPR